VILSKKKRPKTAYDITLQKLNRSFEARERNHVQISPIIKIKELEQFGVSTMDPASTNQIYNTSTASNQPQTEPQEAESEKPSLHLVNKVRKGYLAKYRKEVAKLKKDLTYTLKWKDLRQMVKELQHGVGSNEEEREKSDGLMQYQKRQRKRDLTSKKQRYNSFY
jgi:hypothetical protein